jgi:hypothetical protein
MRMNQEGAAAIIATIVGLFVLLGMAALAIDVGYLFAAKNELQNVSDGASLAAARELGVLYQSKSTAEQQNYVLTADDQLKIRNRAKEVASLNVAGGKANLVIGDADIEIGNWIDDPTDPAYPVAPTLTQPDAVRVAARRDSSFNDPVSTFFATIFKIFGNDFSLVDVNADATAALTGQSTIGEGGLPLPIGISEWWFENNACLDEIVFSPANDPQSCAGWTTFTNWPANDPGIQDLLRGDEESPELGEGDDANFIGGDLSTNTFYELMLLFQREGYDAIPCVTLPCPPAGPGQEVPLLDGAGNQLYYPDLHLITGSPSDKYDDGTPRNYHEWETGVIVYESQDCSNPNQSQPIAGFAQIIMNDVLGPPNKSIRGKVLCKYVEPGDNRGGGGSYGRLGSIPGLVE